MPQNFPILENICFYGVAIHLVIWVSVIRRNFLGVETRPVRPPAAPMPQDFPFMENDYYFVLPFIRWLGCQSFGGISWGWKTDQFALPLRQCPLFNDCEYSMSCVLCQAFFEKLWIFVIDLTGGRKCVIIVP
jgi:hypothetical protein